MNRQEGRQIEIASSTGVCFHSEIKEVAVYRVDIPVIHVVEQVQPIVWKQRNRRDVSYSQTLYIGAPVLEFP